MGGRRGRGAQHCAVWSALGGFRQAALPHSPVLKHREIFPVPWIVLFRGSNEIRHVKGLPLGLAHARGWWLFLL